MNKLIIFVMIFKIFKFVSDFKKTRPSTDYPNINLKTIRKSLTWILHHCR